jgi:hypothetical protein
MSSPKESAMKSHTVTVATAALALATTILVPTARAEDSSTLNPGFVPDTGQINPGHAAAPWRAAPALPQAQQPAQEAARAALMMPDDGTPSVGQGNQVSQGGQATPVVPNSATPSANGDITSTTPSAGGGQPGPIGATLQTMPAKFSQRNDLLDHMPMMAWPLPLNEQQRQQIYQAVMADNSQAIEGASAIKPASSLSIEQKRDLRPLPQAVTGIDGLQGLKYVKGKDKVFLVRPSTGIVVDEITM